MMAVLWIVQKIQLGKKICRIIIIRTSRRHLVILTAHLFTLGTIIFSRYHLSFRLRPCSKWTANSDKILL